MNIKFYQYFYYTNKKHLYTEMVNWSSCINEKYCQLHGYEYKLDFKECTEITPEFNLLEYSISKKIELIYNELILSDCDYLVFVDADAAVNNPNIKIEDLINLQPEYELYLSHGNDKIYSIMTVNTLINKLNNVVQQYGGTNNEYWHTIVKEQNLFRELYGLSCCQYFFNEGLIIIKNTELMRRFWKQCVDFIPLIKARWTDAFLAIDGAVIQETLRLKEFQTCFTFLPDYAQGGVANSFETKYNEDTTFILHNYGDALTLEQKYNMLYNLLLNKHWKYYVQ